MKTALLFILLGGILLTGCDKREAGEPQQTPGTSSFLRAGGDVVSH